MTQTTITTTTTTTTSSSSSSIGSSSSSSSSSSRSSSSSSSSKLEDLTMTIEQLSKAIDTLKGEIAEMQVLIICTITSNSYYYD